MKLRRDREGRDAALRREIAQQQQSNLVLLPPRQPSAGSEFITRLEEHIQPLRVHSVDADNLTLDAVGRARAVLSIFHSKSTLDRVLDLVRTCRAERADGTPTLIIAIQLRQLAEMGEWLQHHARQGDLEGIRLILARDEHEVLTKVADRLGPVSEPNFLAMPVNTEVDDSPLKYYFCISPQIRSLVRTVRELAENNIYRVYVLGGPGAGKTTFAYYYYLCRNKGRFVSVNLTAESTGDKAAMKSLICGHVPGALPESGGREGALSFAGEGVCFLDESHGVSGVVMQVLMEVLDNGQYLPLGATAKRPLQCAVLFASNRSWEHLRSLINLDEHARLGATIVGVSDLREREEDLIAVLAATMAKFKASCTTWTAPIGLHEDAWREILACPWHGNVRALIRVTETACVQNARFGESNIIDGDAVRYGIDLWEPTEHESLKIYASANF